MYAMVRYDVIICYDMSTHEMTYPIYFYIDMYDRIMYTYVHNHVCQHFSLRTLPHTYGVYTSI